MKKSISIVLITVLSVFLLTVNSYAQSFKFIANPEEKIVKPGEKVEIELCIDGIEEIEEGINTIVGNLEYDNNYIDSFVISGTNSWNVTYNDRESSDLKGKFAMITLQNGVKEQANVAKVNLTLKKDLPDSETEIKFKNLVSSDGYSTINTDDKIVKLIVKNEVVEEKGGNGEITPEKKEDEKKAITTIVQYIQTGDNILIYVGILVLAVVGVTVIVILKRKKGKKEDK